MPYLTHERIDGEGIRGEEAAVGGAVVTFVGTPRKTSHGRRILFLEYEAYEPMAEEALERLLAQAQEKWPVSEIRLKHRLGRVSFGEPSVAIQVRAPHRKEAFGVAEFLIDEIKRQVPIWKKEIYGDGSSQWIQCERLVGDSARHCERSEAISPSGIASSLRSSQ